MTDSHPADERGSDRWTAYVAALTGRSSGGNLPVSDRYHLIRDLHGIGWTDAQIATHTHGALSSITAARVRLGLAENPRSDILSWVLYDEVGLPLLVPPDASAKERARAMAQWMAERFGAPTLANYRRVYESGQIPWPGDEVIRQMYPVAAED